MKDKPKDLTNLLAMVIQHELTSDQIEILKDQMDGDPEFLQKLIANVHKITTPTKERTKDCYNKETQEITCPGCGYVANFNEFTVMNNVDKVYQIKPFLKRVKLLRNDLIHECPLCRIYFDECTGHRLNVEEKEIVDKLQR